MTQQDDRVITADLLPGLSEYLASICGGDAVQWQEDVEAISQAMACGDQAGTLEIDVKGEEAADGLVVTLDYGLSDGGPQNARAHQVFLALCIQSLVHQITRPADVHCTNAG